MSDCHHRRRTESDVQFHRSWYRLGRHSKELCQFSELRVDLRRHSSPQLGSDVPGRLHQSDGFPQSEDKRALSSLDAGGGIANLSEAVGAKRSGGHDERHVQSSRQYE